MNIDINRIKPIIKDNNNNNNNDNNNKNNKNINNNNNKCAIIIIIMCNDNMVDRNIKNNNNNTTTNNNTSHRTSTSSADEVIGVKHFQTIDHKLDTVVSAVHENTSSIGRLTTTLQQTYLHQTQARPRIDQQYVPTTIQKNDNKNNHYSSGNYSNNK